MSKDQWFEEYTDRMVLDHLCLLEDHLLDFAKDPSGQCQSCMYWHIVKIRAYCILECPKFSTGDHKKACLSIGSFMDELEGEMKKGLTAKRAGEMVHPVREWRYKIAGFQDQAEDSHVEEISRPRTEAERRERHKKLHGSGKLPPRGTGLVCPAGMEKTDHFCAETVAPIKEFDPDSIRTVVQDDTRVIIGCPKGEYNKITKRCKVGTRAHKILHPAG